MSLSPSKLMLRGVMPCLFLAPFWSTAQDIQLTNINQNNTLINLQSINSIVFSDGNLKVNSNDCQAEYFGLASTETINFNPTVGIENVSKTPSLSIFPNPVESAFTVTVPSELTNQMLRITNISGELVYEVKITSTQSTLSVDHLAAGIYIVNFANTNYKLIKQ